MESFSAPFLRPWSSYCTVEPTACTMLTHTIVPCLDAGPRGCRMPQQPSHPGLQARHDAQGGGGLEGVPELGIVSKWRQKERLKTTAVALVLCLNIGVDPPDVIKISPCVRLECWVDPLSMQPPKALETIGMRPRVRHKKPAMLYHLGYTAMHRVCDRLPIIAFPASCCSSSIKPAGGHTTLSDLGPGQEEAVCSDMEMWSGKNLQAQYERWQPRPK